MKNLWPTKFEASEQRSPKLILEEQGRFLGEITGGIVVGEVAEVPKSVAGLLASKAEFSYSFSLVAKFLDDYSFRVLRVSHDITFYPAMMTLDEEIARELGLITSSGSRKIEIDVAEELEDLLGRIFNSDRMKKVIGAILSMSR